MITLVRIWERSYAQYGTLHYSTVQYSTLHYSTVQYSTVLYSTVHLRNLGADILETAENPIFVGETWDRRSTYKYNKGRKAPGVQQLPAITR